MSEKPKTDPRIDEAELESKKLANKRARMDMHTDFHQKNIANQRAEQEMLLALEQQQLQNTETRLNILASLFEHTQKMPNTESQAWFFRELKALATELQNTKRQKPSMPKLDANEFLE